MNRLRQYFRTKDLKTQGHTQQKGFPPALYFACISIVAALCLALLCWTLRLAYGSVVFQSREPEAIERATRLDPWNASYFAALATRSDPATGDEAMRRATELDPLNSDYWIQRGIRAEFSGDLKSAERFYLEASRVSRLFAPRIALANFYFRQGDREQFWKWARAAFEISFGDLDGAFLLCWQVAPDAQVILDRALPRDPRTLAQFLNFVVRREGVEAGQPVAEELVKRADAASRDALLNDCDELLDGKRFSEAHEIWLGLARRGLVTATGTGAEKNLVYNASLDTVPLHHGFDWNVIPGPEVLVAPDGNPGEIAVSFTGKQPEECEILSQIVALDAGGSYRFSFQGRTLSPSDPGLTWLIEDAGTQIGRAHV